MAAAWLVGATTVLVVSDDYAAYEALQFSKLGNDTVSGVSMKWIQRFDRKNEQDLHRYIAQPHVARYVRGPVLCVGARLGGEVRAFQRLPHVALAIGVDFNPGVKNPHVMFGDAHNLQQFKNGTFGALYSNVLDHILYIDRFAAEAHRVMTPDGSLFVHMLHQSREQDKYAVRDMIEGRTTIERDIESAGWVNAMAPVTERNYARMPIHKYVYVKRGSIAAASATGGGLGGGEGTRRGMAARGGARGAKRSGGGQHRATE